MIKILFLLSFLLTGLDLLAEEKEILFKSHGKKIEQLDLKALGTKEKSMEVQVYEPHDMVQRSYRGFSFNKLMDAIYGQGWRKEEEILFTCVDGYQPSIPVSRFLKYEAYLVYSFGQSNKDEKFEFINKLQNDEHVPLGPFYLIWDNTKDEYLKSMGASGWPYQVNGVDIITFKEKFPKLAPDKKSSPLVKKGFEAFRQHCLTCHKIDGEGGDKAMDLNDPQNITKIRSDAWLKKWITDPKSIKADTLMPALNPAILKNDPQTIEEIIAYLKSKDLSKKKRAKK